MYNFGQPYMPPTQMSVTKQNSNMDWIMSPTIQQVEQIMIQPGQKAWVMVQNEPVFALRTADNMGLIQTDYYRFEKISPNSINSFSNSSFNSFNASIDALERRIDALEKALGGNADE